MWKWVMQELIVLAILNDRHLASISEQRCEW
jgi:hypothetical protein